MTLFIKTLWWRDNYLLIDYYLLINFLFDFSGCRCVDSEERFMVLRQQNFLYAFYLEFLFCVWTFCRHDVHSICLSLSFLHFISFRSLNYTPINIFNIFFFVFLFILHIKTFSIRSPLDSWPNSERLERQFLRLVNWYLHCLYWNDENLNVMLMNDKKMRKLLICTYVKSDGFVSGYQYCGIYPPICGGACDCGGTWWVCICGGLWSVQCVGFWSHGAWVGGLRPKRRLKKCFLSAKKLIQGKTWPIYLATAQKQEYLKVLDFDQEVGNVTVNHYLIQFLQRLYNNKAI